MKQRSWRPWIFGGLALLLFLVCVGLLMWAIHQYGWDWTGFTAYSLPTPQYQRGKTLWDWLQLLIVPAILAAGAGFFTWWSARTERQIAAQRYQQDQELALDKQREDLLQSYLDRMAELLLEKGLRDSQPDAEVRKVARTRTVSTLIQLDGKRARTIFVFLSEAQLTEASDPIIPFKGVDLSSAKWSKGDLAGFNLSGADLSGADLSGADLSEADLSEADLNKANLIGANLIEANLSEANLSEANLSWASLSWANLKFAKLNGADLNGANLVEANLSVADLSKANLIETYLNGANLGGANLSKAKLSKAKLSEAKLIGANISDADLSDTDLSGAYLGVAKLIGADLSGAKLIGADLSGAKLIGADLRGADLSEAKLSEAKLSEANLRWADLSSVRYLENADLDKTILRRATGLTPEQLARCKASGAIIDEEVMPSVSQSQSATVTSSQETPSQALPSPGQAVPSTHVQEATLEDISSQDDAAVEKGTTPSTPSSQDHTTPLSSSQKGPSSVPSIQDNTTLPSSSQDAVS